MNRKEAAYILKDITWLGTNADRERTDEAVRMAIAAMENLDEIKGGLDYLVEEGQRILEKPSAEPENAKRTDESSQNVPKGDLISRKAAIEAIKNADVFVFYDEDTSADDAAEIAIISTKRSAAKGVEELPSAQPEDSRYKQGVLEGKVLMRTEILTKLKEIVGEEVWAAI